MTLADIASYLPTIATALVNPVAGVAALAAQFLGPKLNVGSSVQEVTQKLLGMSPDDMIKLKGLDVELQEHLADNNIALAKLAQEEDLGEQTINLAEAQSHRSNAIDFFVAGWRPSLGWIGSLAILYQFVLRPIANGIIGSVSDVSINIFPALEVQDIIGIVTLLLGHGALRTIDKVKGVSNGS